MAEIMSVKEAARLWNISERRVSTLCKEGKIDGAKKQGKSWTIPIDAAKPSDSRIKNGQYKRMERPKNLPLPIGISDYRLASTEYYYIDKEDISYRIGNNPVIYEKSKGEIQIFGDNYQIYSDGSIIKNNDVTMISNTKNNSTFSKHQSGLANNKKTRKLNNYLSFL